MGDPHKKSPSDGHANRGDGLAMWLLGALGLLWVGGLAIRALRTERLSPAKGGESYAAFGEKSRPHSQPPPHPVRGHESRDASAKWIFGIVVFLLVSGLAIHGLLAWHLSMLKGGSVSTDRWRPAELPGQGPPAQPTLPALQISPPLDWQVFQAREQAELHSYGWISKTAGIVRIPIEQAMEELAREGLPTRDNAQAGLAGPSSYQLIQQRLERREPETQPTK